MPTAEQHQALRSDSLKVSERPGDFIFCQSASWDFLNCMSNTKSNVFKVGLWMLLDAAQAVDGWLLLKSLSSWSMVPKRRVLPLNLCVVLQPKPDW